MPEYNYTELDFTNISTMDKVFTGFYRLWVSTCREIVANVVDDYTVTQDIGELEQLTRLHCAIYCPVTSRHLPMSVPQTVELVNMSNIFFLHVKMSSALRF